MSPLERLFRLELEFHRRLRTEAPGTADASGLHTSYALQSGYEPLIRAVGTATAQDIERLRANASPWPVTPATSSPPTIRSSSSWGFACSIPEPPRYHLAGL